jgi:hypothetical protein
MENMDKKQCEGGMCKSGCSSCGMHSMCGCHGGKHYLIKLILEIIIVILIFWCGFKLGEIVGSIGSGHGMQRGGYGMMMNGYSNNMMNNGMGATPVK